MYQDYFYPKAGGDYRWHLQQKCRQPMAIMDTSEYVQVKLEVN